MLTHEVTDDFARSSCGVGSALMNGVTQSKVGGLYVYEVFNRGLLYIRNDSNHLNSECRPRGPLTPWHNDYDRGARRQISSHGFDYFCQCVY